MPTVLEFTDVMAIWNETKNPIVASELPVDTEEDRQRLKELIVTIISGNEIDNIPSCDCGTIKSKYMLGTICKVCGTMVQDSSKNLQPAVWIKHLVGTKCFIYPDVVMRLKNAVNKDNDVDVVRWLTDTRYIPKIRNKKLLTSLENIPNIKRGYNFFIDNFFDILEAVFNLKEFKSKSYNNFMLLDLLRKNKHLIFPEYLYIPNRSILVMESTNKGIYLNPNVEYVINAVLTSNNNIVRDRINGRNGTTFAQNRASAVMMMLADFYTKKIKNDWAGVNGKSGYFRKHIFATRSHFTFRSVITSIPEAHNITDVYIPWFIGLTAFRPHVINKLLRKRYTLRQAVNLIYSSIYVYNPVLDEILNTLINEAEDNRIPILLGRNPTLLQGSIIRVNISKFKTYNIKDMSISMSDLLAPLMNADYDGDQVHDTMLLDKKANNLCERLDPHYSLLSTHTPGEISGLLKIPKPVVVSISSFLNDVETIPDPVKLARMNEAFKRR